MDIQDEYPWSTHGVPLEYPWSTLQEEVLRFRMDIQDLLRNRRPAETEPLLIQVGKPHGSSAAVVRTLGCDYSVTLLRLSVP